MMKTIGAMALAAAGLVTVAGPLETPVVGDLFLATAGVQAENWEWQGAVDRGDAIEIKGINGAIKATGTSGGQVTVSAVKKGKDDDPADVRIEVVEHTGGVTICAVYPDAGGMRTGRRRAVVEPGQRRKRELHRAGSGRGALRG
jgi:hypothetical protein